MSVVFSPDGKRLVTSTGGGRYGGPPWNTGAAEMKLWDAETGDELLTFDKLDDRGVAFSPDGHRLVVAETKGLKIYDATPLPEKP